MVDVAADRGVAVCSQEHDGFGSGAAAADFDDDGDVDLFLATPDGAADRLYRNLGNGHFEEVAQAMGLGQVLGTGNNRLVAQVDPIKVADHQT